MKKKAKGGNIVKKSEEEKCKRPSWDEYFLELVELVGTRSTCDRGKSGCVIAKEKRILSTGYIGSPVGTKHCDEIGHEMHTVIHEDGHESRHCIRTAHAEQNAIINAARAGVNLLGGTLYLHSEKKNGETGEYDVIDAYPCFICKKMIVNSGIEKVVLDSKSGEPKVYQVSDWVSDWQSNDLLDDVEAYGEKYQVKK
jgi:dCMP deaminase